MSVLLLAAACNRAVLDEDVTGRIRVNMSQDTSEDIVLKSLTDPTEDQVFTLDFIRTYKDGSSKSEYTCLHTAIPAEGVSLPVGPYVIKASCGENSEAAFGEPFYTGEASVNIVANTDHTVDMTAYLSNVKVTVDFADEIKANFREYKVTVRNSRGGTLVFSNVSTPSTIDADGYFKVEAEETLTWTLDLVNNKGVRYSTSDTYYGVKAKEHYNINFAIGEKGEDVGGLYLTIKVDNTTEVKDYFAGVDFGGNDGPVISVNDEFRELLAVDDVLIPFGVEESKVVTLHASKGVKSVVISHSDANLYAEGLPYFTELVGAKPSQISALEAIGVRTSSTSYGVYDPVNVDITSFMAGLPMDKSYKFDFHIYDVYNHMAHLPLDFTVVVDADADMVGVTPWAMFAVAKGKWFVDDMPDGLTFMYRKASAADWQTVDPTHVEYDYVNKTYSADLTGLEAGYQYVVKAVSANDTDTREMSFTTLLAPQIYNMNFDDWYKSGKVWYPFAEGGSHVWDSANEGAATFIGSSTTPASESGDPVKKGNAARMESKYAVLAFAAGNLYTGDFGGIAGVGATLDWGTPFSGRPVALRGYYKYSPKAIDRVDDKYTIVRDDDGDGVPETKNSKDYKGTMDKCQITVILTDWAKPFPINTTAGNFVDFENDPDIIGVVKFESDEEVMDDYREFCLPIEYRDTDTSRVPTYAVVVCAASYLGDYFTGGEGSTMWADEFSFEYDITTLTPEQRAKVNYK